MVSATAVLHEESFTNNEENVALTLMEQIDKLSECISDVGLCLSLSHVTLMDKKNGLMPQIRQV